MKFLRKAFLMAFALFAIPASAQYSFSLLHAPYTPLYTPAAHNLTQDSVWDFTDYYFRIPIGFNFEINGEIHDSIEVRVPDGIVTLYQQCDRQPNVFSGPELFVMSTGVVDRGVFTISQDTAYSPVRYLTTGNIGDRIFKLEWSNVAFVASVWDDYTNFQVWLYEKTGNVEIHYGPTSIQDTTDVWTYNFYGPLVFFLHEIDCFTTTNAKALWLYGYRNNPGVYLFDSLNSSPPQDHISGIPDNGVVYRFSKQTSGVKDKIGEKFSVYPNPAKEFITISPSLPGKQEYQVFNSTGSIISRGEISRSQKINVSRWPSGLYIILLTQNGKNIGSKKLMVE